MIQANLIAIELKEYFRSPAAAFWTFAYPFVTFTLLMLVFGDTTVNSGDGVPMAYGPFLISGMLAINIFSTSLFGFAVPLVEARQRGALKMYQIFPVWRFSYILAVIISRIAIAVVYNALFIVLATAIFRINLGLDIHSWVNLIIYLFFSSAAFVALGFLLASLFRSAAAANAVTNVLFFPILFFSNLFMPAEVFPEFIRDFVHYSPIAVAGAAFREIIVEHKDIWSQGTALVTLTGIFIVSIALSVKTFSWRSE
jgi:ABC-2 type transport system permease protein